MNKQRLEAFSDGVFAIVITLLILDIKIPEVQSTALPAALVKMLPQLVTYVLSFFIIGLYWHLHHQVATQIKLIDGAFIWLNLVWLLFVSVLPFPTALAVNRLYVVAIAAAWFFPWLSYSIYFFVLLWVTARSIRRVSPMIEAQQSP